MLSKKDISAVIVSVFVFTRHAACARLELLSARERALRSLHDNLVNRFLAISVLFKPALKV